MWKWNYCDSDILKAILHVCRYISGWVIEVWDNMNFPHYIPYMQRIWQWSYKKLKLTYSHYNSPKLYAYYVEHKVSELLHCNKQHSFGQFICIFNYFEKYMQSMSEQGFESERTKI